jgi:hypothetical protein
MQPSTLERTKMCRPCSPQHNPSSISVDGCPLTAADIAKRVGMTTAAVRVRMRTGLSPEEIIKEPPPRRGRGRRGSRTCPRCGAAFGGGFAPSALAKRSEFCAPCARKESGAARTARTMATRTSKPCAQCGVLFGRDLYPKALSMAVHCEQCRKPMTITDDHGRTWTMGELSELSGVSPSALTFRRAKGEGWPDIIRPVGSIRKAKP